MSDKMKLIMENWNRFLINEQDPFDQINKDLKSGEDTLARVKEIADKKGIKSYSYVNGKIGGVQLTKDEIEYIETGKKKESSPNLALLTGLYKKRSDILFQTAKNQKDERAKFTFAALSLSLNIFGLLLPNKSIPPVVKELRSTIDRYMKKAKTKETARNKVLSLIDKAIDNSIAIYEDEQIAKVLGITGFQATMKIHDKYNK